MTSRPGQRRRWRWQWGVCEKLAEDWAVATVIWLLCGWSPFIVAQVIHGRGFATAWYDWLLLGLWVVCECEAGL